MVQSSLRAGKRYFVGQSYAKHHELGEFLYSDLMASVCKVTLGGTAFLHNDQYVIKSGKTGMSFSWHQDGAYVHARVGEHPECVTVWCALDNCGEENGTIYILPAGAAGTRKLEEHIRDPVTNDRVGYFGDAAGTPVVCPAGSIAVFSSLVFHRSGANTSGGERRAYLAQYAPTSITNNPGEWPQYFAAPFLREGEVIPESDRAVPPIDTPPPTLPSASASGSGSGSASVSGSASASSAR